MQPFIYNPQGLDLLTLYNEMKTFDNADLQRQVSAHIKHLNKILAKEGKQVLAYAAGLHKDDYAKDCTTFHFYY